MIDKGRKLVCKNCEQKFYSLGKMKNLNCPVCSTEYNLEEELSYLQGTTYAQQPKHQTKNEFSDLENTDNEEAEDNIDIVSLDEAATEEHTEEKN